VIASVTYINTDTDLLLDTDTGFIPEQNDDITIFDKTYIVLSVTKYLWVECIDGFTEMVSKTRLHVNVVVIRK